VTDAAEGESSGPHESTEPTEVRGPTLAEQPDPLGVVPLALAGAAALMLLGAILFAFASAASAHVGAADRFRLLGGAAGPLTALTALVAMVLVLEDRARSTTRVVLAPVASGIATAVALAVVLLGVNGVLTDLTSDAGVLFRLSSLITRLAPIGLGSLTIWLSLGGPGRSR
jgi:hypothetical protein